MRDNTMIIRAACRPIIREIAERNFVNASSVISTSRVAQVAKARREFAWWLRHCWHATIGRGYRLSYPDIAFVVGYKDHTSAIGAIYRVEEEIADRPSTRDELSMIGAYQEERAA